LRKPKFNILRLLLSIGETSGPYNLLCIPLKKRHDITICTFFHSPIKVPKDINIYNGNGSFYCFYKNLRNALNSKDYDVIHAHTNHVAFLFILFFKILKKSQKCNLIMTLHCAYNNLNFRNKLMFLLIFPFLKKLIPCSYTSLKSLPWFVRKLGNKKIQVIHNGVDIRRIENIRKKIEYKREEKFKIVYVGRLIKLKNVINLLYSFNRIKDNRIELIIIGDGNERSFLDEESKTLGIDKYVKITGEIPRDKVYEYLLNSDLFVSISKREGFPVAVIEAMACSCPVILSDIPAHREIADGNKFITLVDPYNIDLLALEILKFRNMGFLKRKLIGDKCRRLVEEKFTLDRMVSKYEEIYYKLLG